jgi:hypothetical protein
MTGPIGVVGLDREMRVVASKVVAPNRVVWLKGSRSILEMPHGAPLPYIGLQLKVVEGG